MANYGIISVPNKSKGANDMQNLVKLLAEIKTRPLKITIDKNGNSKVQQTQRNLLKNEILNAIMQDIASEYEYVYRATDGILLEIANDSIADNLNAETNGSGAITVAIDLKVKDLDNNALDLQEIYELDQQKKLEKAEQKAKDKASKIARDTASRKAKKGE